MSLVTIGIDIGQQRDPTAIAVAEQERREGAEHYLVRHLERLPLGTSYPQIAERLAAVVAGVKARLAEPARYRVAPGVAIVATPPKASLRVYVDATGVGKPVVDLLRGTGCRVTAVYFTHGDRRTVERGEVRLGKAWLVSRLQALLQTNRIHLPRTAEAEALADELLDYEIKVDENANDKYGAFKVGTHDDLVTALGLAVQAEPRVARLRPLDGIDLGGWRPANPGLGWPR